MKGRSKLIYRSFSLYQFYKNFFGRLIALAVFGLTIWLFDNNHVVMSIIGIISLFFFLIIGEDELKMYPDHIRYGPDSILTMGRQRRIFLINDIRSFEVKGSFNMSMDVSSDLHNLNTYRPWWFPSSYRSDPDNFIEITHKDGTVTSIGTHIYIDKLNKAKQVVSELLKS